MLESVALFPSKDWPHNDTLSVPGRALLYSRCDTWRSQEFHAHKYAEGGTDFCDNSIKKMLNQNFFTGMIGIFFCKKITCINDLIWVYAFRWGKIITDFEQEFTRFGHK